MVGKFMQKYKNYIFVEQGHNIDNISTELVQEAFAKGEKSAAGEPEEFALMSRYACAWCARLYQTIEAGAP